MYCRSSAARMATPPVGLRFGTSTRLPAATVFTPLATVHGGGHAGGSYRVPNIEIEVLRVYTNTVPRGHMRAPGAPQTIFAVESDMDMIARELGLDPLEFRLRNALTEGDSGPLGERWQQIRCRPSCTC